MQTKAKGVSKTDFIVCMTDGSKPIQANLAQTPEIVCSLLERGGIIYFPETPFDISASDREFLLADPGRRGRIEAGGAVFHREQAIAGEGAAGG